METPFHDLPGGARVAIIRLRSLGDCVLTTPAIQVLKQHRPDLEIGVVADPAFAPVFERNPDVARVLAPSAFELFRFRPALCLNLHGGPLSLRLTLASAARVRAGFAHHRFSCLYTVRIPRAQDILKVDRKVHTAEHLASAIFYLGVPVCEIPRARLFAAPDHPAAPYAILHPFASEPAKTWPASSFVELARYLQDHAGVDPVFIGATNDDFAAFRQFRCVQGAGLPQLFSLISGAAVFAGNDSGPAHIAAAFGVPSAVLFGASDPEIWRPWKAPHMLLDGRRDGIASISLPEVLRAIESLQQVRV